MIRASLALGTILLAVALAKHGVPGSATALEGEAGFYHAYAGNNLGRLAYSFTSTDPASGASSKSIAVYLKRGRALLGLYFPEPSATMPSIGGQTTVPGIVNVFENRLAQLPDSAVN